METKKLLPNNEDKKGFSCNGTEYFDPKQIYDLTQDSKFKECEKISDCWWFDNNLCFYTDTKYCSKKNNHGNIMICPKERNKK